MELQSISDGAKLSVPNNVVLFVHGDVGQDVKIMCEGMQSKLIVIGNIGDNTEIKIMGSGCVIAKDIGRQCKIWIRGVGAVLCNEIGEDASIIGTGSWLIYANAHASAKLACARNAPRMLRAIDLLSSKAKLVASAAHAGTGAAIIALHELLQVVVATPDTVRSRL